MNEAAITVLTVVVPVMVPVYAMLIKISVDISKIRTIQKLCNHCPKEVA